VVVKGCVRENNPHKTQKHKNTRKHKKTQNKDTFVTKFLYIVILSSHNIYPRFFSDGSIHHQRDILTGGRHPRLGEESPVGFWIPT